MKIFNTISFYFMRPQNEVFGKGLRAFGLVLIFTTVFGGFHLKAATDVTVTVSTTENDPTNANTIPTVITFDKPVWGFGEQDIQVSNAVISDFTGNDGDSVFTLNVNYVADGLITLFIDEGVAQDIDLNLNESAEFSIYANQSPPEVLQLVKADANLTNPTNQTQFDVLIQFNESISNFNIYLLEVENAIVSGVVNVNLQNTDFLVTLSVDETKESPFVVKLDVPEGVFTDDAGNTNLAADKPFEIMFGNKRPTAEFTSISSNPTNEKPIRVLLTINEIFGEKVDGFELSDISTLNVEKIEMVEDNNPEFLLDVTPNGNGLIDITLTLDEHSVTDVAGNTNIASETFKFLFDNQNPGVEITTGVSNPTNLETIPVTINFDQPVWGFRVGDIQIAGHATLTGFTGNDGDNTFTVDIVPNRDGEILLDISQAVAQDEAGNTNQASEQFSIFSDRTKPEVVKLLKKNMGLKNPTNQTAFDVYLEFSESVSNFDDALLEVKDATILNVEDLNAEGRYFVLTVSPQQLNTSKPAFVEVNVPEGVFTDIAGNTNKATEKSFDIMFSNVRPTAEFTDYEFLPVNNTYHVTLSVNEIFGKEVSMLDMDMISTVNVEHLRILVDLNPVFVLEVTPQANGELSLKLNESVINDAAGNANVGSNWFTLNHMDTDCSGEPEGEAYIDSCGVCAGGNTGIEPVSDPAECDITNVIEADAQKLISLYPNPSSDVFNIEASGTFTYRVMSLTGQLIEQGMGENITSTSGRLQAGVYLLEIVTDTEHKTIKIVKH